MKKFLLLLLVMTVCLSSLIGCSDFDNENSLPNTPPEDVEFSKFLDTENFVPGVSQGEFMEHMAKYSHEGTPITYIVVGYHYDTYSGGGFSAGGDYLDSQMIIRQKITLQIILTECGPKSSLTD